MSKMRKMSKMRNIVNVIKASVYMILGLAGVIFLLWCGTAMWTSSTFLPCYIGSTLIIGNKILRYELYLGIAVCGVLCVMLFEYGGTYLVRKIQKSIQKRRLQKIFF